MPPMYPIDRPVRHRPTTPLVPGKARSILLQSNDPDHPGQFVTTVTDGSGAIIQCLRVDRVPQAGQVLSLLCPDPTYGRVRFICRVVRSVRYRTEVNPGMGGEHFAVVWLAITALGRSDHLSKAMHAVGMTHIPDLSEIPDSLPPRHELIFHATEHAVELVELPPGRRKVATRKLSQAKRRIDEPGWVGHHGSQRD